MSAVRTRSGAESVAPYRKAIALAGLNALYYLVLTADIRAVAQANILASIVINLVVAALSFTILKRIQEASGPLLRVAYVLGGTSGTVIGIVVTKSVFGH